MLRCGLCFLFSAGKKNPRPNGEGLELVCVVKVCASKLWFASYHHSEASEGVFVGFLKDNGAVRL